MMIATAEGWVVKTSLDNILCENGERYAAMFVGGPCGYRPRVFARQATAEKHAKRLAVVGGRAVRYGEAWTKGS